MKSEHLLTMKHIILSVVACIFFASSSESLGGKVFNIWPKTKVQQRIVGHLEDTLQGLDIWQKPRVIGREAKVFVPETQLDNFRSLMDGNSIIYDVLMDDPKSVLENEFYQNVEARSKLKDGKISFTAYHSHDEINEYLDDLARRYPERVTVETAALTESRRDIKVIKISTGGGTNTSKPVIILDAGIHAREWISPPLALYMIHKLVENITQPDVAHEIDWVIFPVLNPDGYEFSRFDPGTRMWRKNRSVVSSTDCPGVDNNRNFDFHWMESGSTNDSCRNTYAGPEAASEIETRTLSDELVRYGNRTKAYVGTHSHGGFFIYPFVFDGSMPPNFDEVHNVGLRVARSIDDHSAPGSPAYLVGNGAGDCCPSSGGSDDFAMGVGGVPLAYTLELPGGGATGFDPPPSRIMQTVTETWPGIVTLARYVLYLM